MTFFLDHTPVLFLFFLSLMTLFYEAAIEVLSQIGGRYYIAQVFDLMTAFDEVGVYE